MLEVEDLHVRDDRGLQAVAACRSQCAAARSSRSPGSTATASSELVEAIAGLRASDSRPDRVAGEDVTGAGVARPRVDAGLGHIAEDRQRRGLVLDFTLAENLALRDYRSPPLLARRLAQPRAHQARAPARC